MTARLALVLSLVLAFGNSQGYGQGLGGGLPTPAPASGVARQVTSVLRLSPNGVSEPMDFMVPPHTRSLTVVVVGKPENLYGLASLQTADGTEQVQLDVSTSHGATMDESYYDEEIGVMPGNFYQNIRLGTFTNVYPYAPGQSLAPGASRLRVVSNAVGGGDVTVTVLMPAEDGGRVLHINVIVASDEPDAREQPPTFLPAAKAIFAQAGIQLAVDQIKLLRNTRFSRITEWSEPQEMPQSQLAQLAIAGRKLVASDALNIYVVDSLPMAVYGLSLGTPGPPVSSSYYNGVVLRPLGSDDLMALVFTHEVSHFLGLQHLVDVSPSGKRYVDPLPDTEPGQKNLMERTGTNLTPGQAFVLSRSALLRTE